MKQFVLYLTLFRIFAGPCIFFMIFIFDADLLALFIFTLASISDFLDGRLARSYNVESTLGAVLDPVADKILILFALFTITLITNDPFVGCISSLILAREYWVSALREYSAKKSIHEATKVTFLAKAKTTVQFFAIAMFFFGFGIDSALIIFLGSFMLFLALLLTITTGIDYTIKVLKYNHHN